MSDTPGACRDPRMRSWSRDKDMWKRRCSIICQVNRKRETDLDLLFDCIEPNLSDRDFFIRKAIGWALRDLAWTDLDTVESYVAHNHDRLSPLSRREALKNAAKIRAYVRRHSLRHLRFSARRSHSVGLGCEQLEDPQVS